MLILWAYLHEKRLMEEELYKMEEKYVIELLKAAKNNGN